MQGDSTKAPAKKRSKKAKEKDSEEEVTLPVSLGSRSRPTKQPSSVECSPLTLSATDLLSADPTSAPNSGLPKKQQPK